MMMYLRPLHPPDGKSKISKSKMDGGHLENRKIPISPKPFG